MGEWSPRIGDTVIYKGRKAVVKEIYLHSPSNGGPPNVFVDLEEYRRPGGRRLAAEEVVARKMMGETLEPQRWRVNASKIGQIGG